MAVTAYERGQASLYFGSSLEFRNLYCKALTYQMGMNFGAYFSDYNTMGEIETFWSKKGNLTDYHLDFQENFTLQIKGSKTWRFKRSGVKYPLLGYTPHYAKSVNLEEQSKVHLAFQGVDINKEYQKLSEEVYEVTLKEGDILYHPAGIWHQVECMTDDSISINFSLRQIRQADLISNAQRMLLLSIPSTREGIRLGSMENFGKLTKDGQALSSLAFNPKYLMPPCIFIPRILEYNLDNSPEDNRAHLSLNFYKKVTDSEFPSLQQLGAKGLSIVLNPFFTLTKVSDLPQKPEDLNDDEEEESMKYIVNGLFGTEDFSSIVRVILKTTDKQTAEMCDRIIAWRTTKESPEIFSDKRTISDLSLGLGKNLQSTHAIRSLLYNGLIVIS